MKHLYRKLNYKAIGWGAESKHLMNPVFQYNAYYHREASMENKLLLPYYLLMPSEPLILKLAKLGEAGKLM